MIAEENSANPFLVITSISSANAVMRELAKGSADHGFTFLVVGDTKSPSDFHLEGARFLSVTDQQALDLRFPKLCPTSHYARKNIGYLVAMAEGASMIVETDDDNFPLDSFWAPRRRRQAAKSHNVQGWCNAYRYFSDALLWPRGLPLDEIHRAQPSYDDLPIGEVDCPIQQGLANDNPDVDAIYRMLLPLPQLFRTDRRVALGEGSWCPFNSQNTSWWRPTFPILYLPAYCSFRMTDIWRSFVAQRIAWINGWHILFHEPTVRQDRNEHSLMRDFEDEVPGYLYNRRITELLDRATLRPGVEYLFENLLLCYETLVRAEIFSGQELPLLECWISDCRSMAPPCVAHR